MARSAGFDHGYVSLLPPINVNLPVLTTERSAFIALPVVMITGGDCYEIRSACELDARWVEWFDRRAVIPQLVGETILHGLIVDQAQLHGVLMKIRDPGLKLASVNRIDPNTQEH